MAATNDSTRGPVLLSVAMGTASIAFATVVIRFCVRKRISNNVGIDDYAIAVASVRDNTPFPPFPPLSVLVLTGGSTTAYGLRRHHLQYRRQRLHG